MARKKKTNCKQCKYSNVVSGGTIICAYLMITKKRRQSDPNSCNKFEEGDRIQLGRDEEYIGEM